MAERDAGRVPVRPAPDQTERAQALLVPLREVVLAVDRLGALEVEDGEDPVVEHEIGGRARDAKAAERLELEEPSCERRRSLAGLLLRDGRPELGLVSLLGDHRLLLRPGHEAGEEAARKAAALRPWQVEVPRAAAVDAKVAFGILVEPQEHVIV